ncbi:3-oxoacyl-ACP reductase FabG [Gammaproteobacteria bacterium]|jgi:NAD(P)-dependent dehydrogenase (short-subunit alcohol dehydrogenase family)|nr:3-oxoacyl-ACP reductase FabG [Gammaproteobacteria bacterium]MDC0129903.1 3-oxoacyl-ACP reductase FabG [Gammaproteobacteria bacterium]
MSLDKRVALVTGGSRGLGRGIVIALANAGFDVAFTYNIDIDAAQRVLKETIEAKGKVQAFQMNVGSRTSIKTAVESVVREYHEINILVNNAGVAQEKLFETITDKDWEKMLNVNLQGPFALIQEIIPSMVLKKWGRIINISSIGGQWGGFNQVHYAAAKAGLINLTQSIAKIYSMHGVTSNAIAPGLISTDMADAELNSEAGSEKVKGIPMNRIGTVEDVGSSVVFLSSDDSSYITGQTINLNGGMFFST